MKGKIKVFALTLALCMALSSLALASSLSFTGTVGALAQSDVLSPAGGTVESVPVAAGQKVKAGDVLATLQTVKVYAQQDGTVTGVFGQPGDDAETLIARYGAVMYIEGASRYTIAASINNAYETTANQYVRVGETVYLRCYSDGAHRGTGLITAVSGTSFTVEVTAGDFLLGESVSVFRAETCKTADRIGRGSLSRVDPVAVTGTGSIVSYAVQNGDSVQRGDLLFETLTGAGDGLAAVTAQILAPCDGIVAQVNVTRGASVAQGDTAAVIYPLDSLCAVVEADEYDLAELSVGDAMTVELLWNQDQGVAYDGVIADISFLASETESEDTASYTLRVRFTPDENTRYGMRAVVAAKE